MTPRPMLSTLRSLPQDEYMRIKVRDLRSLIEGEMALLAKIGELAESRTIELLPDEYPLRVVKFEGSA